MNTKIYVNYSKQNEEIPWGEVRVTMGEGEQEVLSVRIEKHSDGTHRVYLYPPDSNYDLREPDLIGSFPEEDLKVCLDNE